MAADDRRRARRRGSARSRCSPTRTSCCRSDPRNGQRVVEPEARRDRGADLERRGRRGRRRVQHVHRAPDRVGSRSRRRAHRRRRSPARGRPPAPARDRRGSISGTNSPHRRGEAAPAERTQPSRRARSASWWDANRRNPRNANVSRRCRSVEPSPLVALAGEREHGVRSDVDVPVDPAGEVHAEERELRDRARGRRACGRGARSTEPARGTRRGTRSRARRRAPSGPLTACATSSACRPAQVTTRCASIGPPVVSTTIPDAVSDAETHRASEADRGSRLLDLGGERRGTRRRSRRCRCRARAARRCPRRAVRSRAVARGPIRLGAHAVRRAAAFELVEADAGRRRRARPRPCRRRRGRCRAPCSTAPSRCGPRCRAGPCRSRAGSRRPRGSRPELRPLWWAPTDASFSTTTTDRSGMEADDRARRRQPDDPSTYDEHVGTIHSATR